ncbi:MAG: metallophosphoesterase [Clostridia bacterium]|nr:metallophosphoesterase [Clostridia bacterium]
MALYTIGDLHLSGSVNKPMDKFGSRWTDHANKIRTRWTHLITENDTVMLPGDFSWGMTLDEAAADFRFLSALPGKKILSKGNHDFWWTGVSKMRQFLDSIGSEDITFLHNSAVRAEGFILAGSRGWFLEEKQQNTIFPTDYEKLVNRETMRLELSLTEAEKLRTGNEEILVFLHFPPVYGDFLCRPLVETMQAHGIRRCYFGHIHGRYAPDAAAEYGGIRFELVSADFLDFVPLRIFA